METESTLYKKYRPSKLEDVIGNEALINSLQNVVERNKLPHALLFTGPTGCGKTTVARILAKRLEVSAQDIQEINSASFRGIETIRDLISKAGFFPIASKCKVYIIDEVHQMTKDAQNAFLKILEDTPKHVYFFLCTTDEQQLIAPIKSRCTQYQMQPLEDTEMMLLLRRIVSNEKNTISKTVYQHIIKASQGHPRAAINLLEQVIYSNEEDSETVLEMIKNNEFIETESIELCRALIGGKNWKQVSTILTGLKKVDPEKIRRQVLGYAQSVLLNGTNDQAALVLEEFVQPFYGGGFPQLVFACYAVIRNPSLS